MGGVSPGHPCFFGGGTDGNQLTRMRLRMIEEGRRKRTFVILHGEWSRFRPRLPEVGIRFSEEYQKISPPLLSPFTRLPFEIWSPTRGILPNLRWRRIDRNDPCRESRQPTTAPMTMTISLNENSSLVRPTDPKWLA
jgi:hypothetical protein